MRFMLFIYPPTPGDENYEPTAEDVEAMTKYNESLTKAGVLLALDGCSRSRRAPGSPSPAASPT